MAFMDFEMFLSCGHASISRFQERRRACAHPGLHHGTRLCPTLTGSRLRGHNGQPTLDCCDIARAGSCGLRKGRRSRTNPVKRTGNSPVRSPCGERKAHSLWRVCLSQARRDSPVEFGSTTSFIQFGREAESFLDPLNRFSNPGSRTDTPPVPRSLACCNLRSKTR